MKTPFYVSMVLTPEKTVIVVALGFDRNTIIQRALDKHPSMPFLCLDQRDKHFDAKVSEWLVDFDVLGAENSKLVHGVWETVSLKIKTL